jgi:hypothetical protein
MTLEQARDVIAKANGKTSWEDWGWKCSEPYGKDIPSKYQDEAWKLYAIELAKEAYKAGGNGGYYDEGLGGMNYEYSEEKWNEFIKTKL